MISILFVRGTSVLSKLIMYATGEDVSHVALQWDELVVHSNLLGVQVAFLAEFIEKDIPIHTIDLGDTPELRDKLTSAILTRRSHLYDFGAFLFLGISLILHKKLGLPMPSRNLWQCNGMFLCTEFVTDILSGRENSLITPGQLYTTLNEVHTE